MSEAPAAAAVPTPPLPPATSRRASYLFAPFLMVLALGSAGLGSMWERQQLSGSFLSVLPSLSTTPFLRSSSSPSASNSSLPSSSFSSALSSQSSVPSSSSLSSSFHPTCDYPVYRPNPSCPRFVNINLIGKRGLGDRFLQFCIVLLVALDTNSVPVRLDMHTASGRHGNYTGLEDFLPVGHSLPTIGEVREQYPNLRQITPEYAGSYRDHIAWLKAGGSKEEPKEDAKEGEDDPRCNLLMTVNMDVCGDARREACYYLEEPHYMRVKDLLRCWMLNLSPEAIPRLVWKDGKEAEGEGGGMQIEKGEQKCYNVAIHLRVGDKNLHENDAAYFQSMKDTIAVALVGFECVHYHLFYEEAALIKRAEEEEEKMRMEEMSKKEKEDEEKRGAVVLEQERRNEKEEKVRRETLNTWMEGEPPFPFLAEIFREEAVVLEEEVVAKEKDGEGEERGDDEGVEEMEGTEAMVGANERSSKLTRKQRVRVSYHPKIDVRSTLYHFMDADMLVLTGSSFPLIAALLSPKPVVLLGQPKESTTGGGPQGNGWVEGKWFGGYGVGGRDGDIALLTDQGKVVNPQTDSEWRAMVEMKYLTAAGRRVPYV